MRTRLVESREIAPEIRHFVFELPDAREFLYVPGQWVSFEETVDGQPITRAYSIAAPPAGNRFELCLNRVQDGHLSPYLFTLRPGDTVEMRGPFGTFVWREPAQDSVLVATGTGIAPFRAMLPPRLAKDHLHRITLLFGVRHEHSLLYRDEFEAMERSHPNFHFWPTITRPGSTWTGRTGRVQEHLERAIGPSRRDLDVYICGLREMVDNVRAILKNMGFERRRIIYEKYD